MANKLKKLPNFLNKSPWLWRSCTQSRTLSFRHPNDIFRTINSAYDEEEEDFYDYDDEDDEKETTQDDMSNDEDQIEALVRGLRVRQGKRLFLELDETNSIMTATATTTVAVATVGAGNYHVPFKESVAMAMESKDPYLDFKKSMEEMVEAHELKDWKGMERLLSWYLKANGNANHEFIIGAFVDLLVDLAFAASSNLSNNSSSSPSSSSSSTTTTSSLLCSSSSSIFPNSSSCSSCSSFRAPNSIISSNSVETADELECSCSSSSIRVAPPCLSSLFEDDEEEDIEEGF
ncbi:hypothetical protein IC582_018744 [Cucumis melo]|uniref:Transcription repressor n=1 Tax=Cucumis melo TaxID=3656 RepID=A0A1S3CHG0_CUCME|nr:transcription repressor OFP13 [Cucumis melo]